MTNNDLVEDILSKKYLFFGGKGGVGKTTFSAATAVLASDMGYKTLVISTDPAHSLSDSFDYQIGGQDFTKIPNTSNLYALEIDTERAVSEYGDLLATQDDTGLFNEIIGEDPSNLMLPGSDEAVAFIQLLSFMENPEFDLIVFDTAPTGHTLKLLSLPEMMDSWLFKLIKMRRRLSNMMGVVKQLFSGPRSQSQEEQAFAALEEMKRRVERARVHLANEEETEFIAVTIPTVMAIWETERLIRTLNQYSIPIKRIIINQLQPDNPSCPYCRTRHKMTQENLEQLHFLYEDLYELIEVPMFEYEIRGVQRLRELARLVYLEAENV